MKNQFLMLLLFATFSQMRAQIYLAGDTTGLYRLQLEKTFLPNILVAFDLDCDGAEDLNISSFDGQTPSNPWDRLSFSMADGVEVLNSGVGLVTLFDFGDTLFLTRPVWTAHLDFLYGTGRLGTYGHHQIDHKFIAFRKIYPQDTSFLFLELTTRGIEFTLHAIYSVCSQNPISVISDIVAVGERATFGAYPNPFFNQLFIKGLDFDSGVIFSVDGREVLRIRASDSVATNGLPEGIYFLFLEKNSKPVLFQKLIKINP